MRLTNLPFLRLLLSCGGSSLDITPATKSTGTTRRFVACCILRAYVKMLVQARTSPSLHSFSYSVLTPLPPRPDLPALWPSVGRAPPTQPAWSADNYTALDFHYANATHFHPITDESNTYSTHVFTEQIQSVITRSAGVDQPFFIYAPFEAVHGASSCYVEGRPPNCKTPDGDELQVCTSMYICTRVLGYVL